VLVLSAATHEYDDATLLVREMLTVPPLQLVADDALVIAGIGLTVTVTVCGVPGQLLALEVGVTV
jgi:hypothetical protein